MNTTMNVLNSLVAAPAPDGSGGITFNTAGIIAWLQNNVIKLILAFIALGMLARAKRAKFAENAGVVANVLLAIGVFVGGTFLVALANGAVGIASGGGGN